MTDEQILKLAENCMTLSWDETYKAIPEQILKFAALIYTEGFKEGYDDGKFENAEPTWLG